MKIPLCTLLSFVILCSSLWAFDLSRTVKILEQKQIDPYTRFWKADTLVRMNASDSLGIVAYREILLP